MSLIFNTIHKEGDAKEEYILLKATETVNAGDYAIVDRTFDEYGIVSNIHKHYFRFPEQEINKGEYVALRTGKGKYNQGTLKDGSIVHRFYFNSDAPILNDDEIEKLELLKVQTVATKVLIEEKVKFKLRPDNLKYAGKK